MTAALAAFPPLPPSPVVPCSCSRPGVLRGDGENPSTSGAEEDECDDAIGLEEAGGNIRPGIVHRLDKGTSGLIVVAKSEAALQVRQPQPPERPLAAFTRLRCPGLPEPCTAVQGQDRAEDLRQRCCGDPVASSGGWGLGWQAFRSFFYTRRFPAGAGGDQHRPRPA